MFCVVKLLCRPDNLIIVPSKWIKDLKDQDFYNCGINVHKKHIVFVSQDADFQPSFNNVVLNAIFVPEENGFYYGCIEYAHGEFSHNKQ